jgi:hypothetical protein
MGKLVNEGKKWLKKRPAVVHLLTCWLMVFSGNQATNEHILAKGCCGISNDSRWLSECSG